ncbi:type II toxin-antitoxin system PemK/MazF family toxin [Schleiferilactobacillus perolens]|jgi:mRNA interferase MazF|uniref:type II toxin-antitoxin system PemK/MazF family toxin n=1 Tax=Schleiferilactobacillus perolens TaxID=100468 RepID=UPI002357E23D|nr:type II toxin-antitoxin system PemK/MazF family toxin [Schleiferilactobacillus perolens]MCI2170123.1 type II toxin-antitoxin system PemK/MazF family toxin [Schleiferilactobacillus perolens]
MVAMPKQGDVIKIDAEPHVGREMGGRSPETGNNQRSMIVWTNSGYNAKTQLVGGMMVSTGDYAKRTPHLAIRNEPDSHIYGNIVTWQVISYDFVKRHGRIVGHVSDGLLRTLLTKVHQIYSFPE